MDRIDKILLKIVGVITMIFVIVALPLKETMPHGNYIYLLLAFSMLTSFI